MTPEDCERIPCPAPSLCDGRKSATCPQCIELLCGIRLNPYPTPAQMRADLADADALLRVFAGL